MVRPYNKRDYIALVPEVDATLSDLLGSNFYTKEQNVQFRVAAMTPFFRRTGTSVWTKKIQKFISKLDV